MSTAKSPPMRRRFDFAQFKTLDDQAGTFEGYMSVFGVEDSGGDIVEPGAFTKTLNELKAKQQERQRQGLPSGRYILPIFWNHDPDQCIGGLLDASEDERGVYVKGELDPNVEQARNAYSGLKAGYIPGMSFGYFTIRATYDRQGVRHLKEVSCFESTITPVPMSDLALVTEIKTDGTHDNGGTTPQKGTNMATKQPPVPVKRPNGLPQQKAQDFSTTFAGLMQGDTLQREWAKAFDAFVRSVWNTLIDAKYPPYVADGDTPPDPQEVVQTTIDQFSAAVSDLAKRSIDAGFYPQLDDDCDSFADPDDDDDEKEYMARNLSGAEHKAGRSMSAANHKEFGTGLTQVKDAMGQLAKAHKALSTLHDKLNPTADPKASGASDDDTSGSDTTSAGGKSLQLGAGRQANGHTGDTTPSGDDNDLSKRIQAQLAALKRGA
ncbi:MAG: HK97 family phage prohead protease [Ktedonobacterales bacterium]